MNRILEKFKKGEPSIGSFTHMKSTVAVECIGMGGMDYVIIDMEHGATGVDFMATAVTAADAAGVTPLVRINAITREAVLQPLDVGAKGIVVPAVETVEEVQQLVQYAKFAPLGKRGFCPTRDGGWGFSDLALQGADAYMTDCNSQTLLLPQCETAGCLEHIEEITAIDGVDGILVGPLDLSISLGCPMQLDHPQMVAALERIQAACKKNGKISVIFCGDAQTARARISAGYDSVAVSVDTLLCIQTYRTMGGEIKA